MASTFFFAVVVPSGQRRGQSFRLLLPVARESAGAATRFYLYPITRDYTPGDGGLYWILTRSLFPRLKGEPRLAEAVAVAGLAAFERRRRRAVLLIASGREPDRGPLDAAQARRYLRSLHVPLVVWTPDRKPSAALDAWGEPASVGGVDHFQYQTDQLSKLLERQWVVWLEGEHLPQDIRLSPCARGIRLVSAGGLDGNGGTNGNRTRAATESPASR